MTMTNAIHVRPDDIDTLRPKSSETYHILNTPLLLIEQEATQYWVNADFVRTCIYSYHKIIQSVTITHTIYKGQRGFRKLTVLLTTGYRFSIISTYALIKRILYEHCTTANIVAGFLDPLNHYPTTRPYFYGDYPCEDFQIAEHGQPLAGNLMEWLKKNVTGVLYVGVHSPRLDQQGVAAVLWVELLDGRVLWSAEHERELWWLFQSEALREIDWTVTPVFRWAISQPPSSMEDDHD